MTGHRCVLVDAHVHFYASFDASRFLDAAAENFREAGERLGISGPPLGILLFTEASSQRHFKRFRRAVEGDELWPWRLRRTGEAGSLIAWRERTPVLVLVEGRQVKSAEGLEVLAPASQEDFPDGLPLIETWKKVRASGALPILPWGFGKWWLGRGHLVRRLVESARPHELYLGDSKGRPCAGRPPALIRAATARGILNLPGTDPFPFPPHGTRAGSFGFALRQSVNLDAPAESLVTHIRGLTTQPETFGRGESIPGFCVSQVRLRLT